MANDFKITITDNRIPELLRRLPREVDAIVQKTARDVETDAKTSMGGAKHGRLYPKKAITVGAKGKRGKGLIAAGASAPGGRVTVGYDTHRASAPGEAPAIDSGNLAGSIEVKKTGEGMAEVSANTAYAIALELGSRKMAARPFFRPAAERAKKNFIAALNQLEDRLR